MADGLGRAALYPPGPAELPEAGTDAFVALRSDKATGACAVLSSPLPPGHHFEGRVHVRFHDGSGEARMMHSVCSGRSRSSCSNPIRSSHWCMTTDGEPSLAM